MLDNEMNASVSSEETRAEQKEDNVEDVSLVHEEETSLNKEEADEAPASSDGTMEEEKATNEEAKEEKTNPGQENPAPAKQETKAKREPVKKKKVQTKSNRKRLSAQDKIKQREQEQWKDYYWFDRPSSLKNLFFLGSVIKWFARIICYNFDKEYRLAVDRALAEMDDNTKEEKPEKETKKKTGKEARDKEKDEKAQNKDEKGKEEKGIDKEGKEESSFDLDFDDLSLDDLPDNSSTSKDVNDIEAESKEEAKNKEKTFDEMRDEAAGENGFTAITNDKEKADVYLKMIENGTLTLDTVGNITTDEISKNKEMNEVFNSLFDTLSKEYEKEEKNPSWAKSDIISRQPAFIQYMAPSELASYNNQKRQYDCYTLAKLIVNNPKCLSYLPMEIPLKHQNAVFEKVEQEIAKREEKGKYSKAVFLRQIAKPNKDHPEKDDLRKFLFDKEKTEIISAIKESNYAKIPEGALKIPEITESLAEEDRTNILNNIGTSLENPELSGETRTVLESLRSDIEKSAENKGKEQGKKTKTLKAQLKENKGEQNKETDEKGLDFDALEI